MNWEQLKDKIFYCDGSFRDIYIFNTRRDDWQIWADFVNKNYNTSLHLLETDINEENIDLNKIFGYWDGESENYSTATVFVGKIQINAHFFSENEIENDITPTEFNSIEDHTKLIKYMTGLSKAVNKKVFLTPENTPEIILISVDNDEVIINLD